MRPLVFSRELVVRSFEADNPEIHLVRAPNGTWNFSSLSHGSAQNPAQQTTSNLTVGEITIKDGRATIDSLPAPGQPVDNRRQVYDHLDIAIQQFSTTKAFPFTISADLAGNGTANLTGNAGPLNPQDATLTPFDAQIALKHLDPVVAGLIEPALGVSMLADLDAHVTSNGASVTSTGTIHAANLVLLKGGRPTPKPVDITYNVIHSLKDSTGQVQDLTLKTGAVATHINGTYQLAGNLPTFDLKLVAKSVPIDDLQALLPAVGVKLPNGSVLKGGTLSTNLAITGSARNNVIAGPFEIDNTNMVGFNLGSKISGIAAMGGVKTGDTTAIQTMRADIRLSQAGIEANNIYAVMPALGESSGSGTVSPAGALNFRMVAKVTTAQGIGKAGVGLLTALNGTAGAVGKSAAATGVRINITGTADNPVITADVSGVVKANATQILNKTGLSGLGGLFGKKK